MNTTPAPIRRLQPLGQPPAVRAVDRVIHQPDGKRPAHPTFNSAV